MGKNRLFIPQETMDRWVDEARAVVQDDELCLADEGKVYRLASAVLFLREATGTDDPHDLVGRVKEEAQLTILGADAYMDSVLLDDNAYDVCRGFVAVPAIAETRKTTIPPPPKLVGVSADATPSAEISSPPDIIDEPPSAPTIDEPDGDSPETFEEHDAHDTANEGLELATDDAEADGLEDLSHELEEIAEGDQPAQPEDKTPSSGPEEEDDVLAKLLLKSLK